MTRRDATPRVPELDGIRGTAIAMIVLYHWIILPSSGTDALLPALLVRVGVLGWSGVDLFFVLSGFLIGGILLDARLATNYFEVFYLRRAYRILPLYLAVCVAFWLSRSLPVGWLMAGSVS